MFFVTILLLTIGNAKELQLYDDGFLEEGMQIVNPQNLSVACVREKDHRWIGVNNMTNGNYIVLTTFNTSLSTKVNGTTNDYYRTLKFTARYENDTVDDIALNVMIFPTDFNAVYNNNQLEAVTGYQVKVKHNHNTKVSILLNNFNLNEQVGTIVFMRQNGTTDDGINLRLRDIRIDTNTDETQLYENSASHMVFTLLLGLLLFFF